MRSTRDALDDEAEVWERKLLCHIPRLTQTLVFG